MRYAFGLASVLVVIGLIALIMSYQLDYSIKPALQLKKQVEPAVQQLSGRTADGTPLYRTVTLVAMPDDSRPRTLLVTAIDPASPLVTNLGLAVNDDVLRIGTQGGMMRVADFNDSEMAKLKVSEAYQLGLPIEIRRDGQVMELQPGTVPSNLMRPGSVQNAPPPAPTNPNPTPPRSSPRSQAEDVINRIPR